MNCENRHAVFVYGTLMRGQRAHHMLETSEYAGVYSLQDYAMYHLGRYPGIVARPGEVTVGEVYFVTDDMLRSMDEYEDEGYLYHRRTVTVTQGEQRLEVQVYVYALSVEGCPLLPSENGSRNWVG